MTHRPILLDEGADRRLAGWLRTKGHDVKVVSIDYPAGIDDRRILQFALNEDRLVVTNDTDFGELVVRDGMPHAGVILLRLRSISLSVIQGQIDLILTDYADQLDRFFVASDEGVRVR